MANENEDGGGAHADPSTARAPVSSRVLTFSDGRNGPGLGGTHVVAAALLVVALWVGARGFPELVPPFGALLGGVAWVVGLLLLGRGAFRHRALSLPGVAAILVGDVMVSTDSWSTVALAAFAIAVIWFDRRTGDEA